MSKIGKKSISIPQGVEVNIGNRSIGFKGPQGALDVLIPVYIQTEIKDGQLLFSPQNDSEQTIANWGTVRALANNAIIGVTKGFEKNLEIEGIGYRAQIDGNTLVLNIGFSHPVKIDPPQGIKISVSKNIITISGIDKNLVGRVAAKIRAVRKAEPYKGKGIRYRGEVIRKKAGKKVAGTAK